MPQLLDMGTLIAPFAQNVPAFTAANAIREAARTFFGAVPVLREWVELETELGDYRYELYPVEPDTEIAQILCVKRDDFDHLDHRNDFAQTNLHGTPNRYTTAADRDWETG